MSEYKKRSDLIRKVEKKMKRRNRKVSTFLFIFGLLLGLAVGIWLLVSGIVPQTLFGATPEASLEPVPPMITDAPLEPEITIAPEIQPAPEEIETPIPEPTEDPVPTDPPLEEPPQDQAQAPEGDVAPAFAVDQKAAAPEGMEEVPSQPEEVPTEVPAEPAPPAEEQPPAEPEAPAEPVATPRVFTSVAKGDRTEDVVAVQAKLIELGLLSGAPDGIFGGYTEDAVKAYQTSKGIEATGIADEATQKLLFDYVEPEPVELAKVEKTPEPVENITMAMGETYTYKDQFTFVLDRYDFKQLVEGSNVDAEGDSIPTSFESMNSDHTYLCLTGTVTNIGQSDFTPNRFRFTAVAGTQEEYSGLAAIETDNGRSLMGYGALEPGLSTALVLLVEVPIALEGSADPIMATITVGNTIYHLTLR